MFVFNSEVNEKIIGEGIVRKILAGSKDLMVCEMKFEKGIVLPTHIHPHEQISYIISGECEYMVNAEKKIMKAGDSAWIPGNIPHGVVRVLEDLVLLDVFTPAREDFILEEKDSQLFGGRD